MSLPNLVIAGAPKSGTTSLFKWLQAHPSVVTAQNKETYYLMDSGYPMFNEKSNYLAGGLEGYSALFPEYEAGQLCIEATPDYMYQQTALRVLCELPTKPMIIFILRNPVERVRSLIRFAQNNVGSLRLDISEREFVNLVKEGTFHSDKILENALLHSEYHVWLDAWIQSCGAERVKILFFDDLVNDPRAFMKQFCDLTGIDRSFYQEFEFKPENQSRVIRSSGLLKFRNFLERLSPKLLQFTYAKLIYRFLNNSSLRYQQPDGFMLQAELYDYFAEPNEKLESLLDKKLPSAWTVKPFRAQIISAHSENLTKSTIKNFSVIFDLLFALFAMIGVVGVWARRAVSSSIGKFPMTNAVFRKMGYLPIREHYYEPLTFDAIGGKYRDKVAQILFKKQKDFEFLRSIARPDEFKREYSDGAIRELGFRFGNGAFESGDAETLYYFVRGIKPRKVIEIGAGNSSLIISAALKANGAEGEPGKHIIIEPYENPWLERLDAQVIRERVEHVDFSVFQNLSAGDVLFIDSSHVVRAQNDCVFEYTELLPSLPSGVVVHIHDIFTPFDYPDDWLNKHFYLWAEQYVLEALLANGSDWEILAPLCWLAQDEQQFKAICPFFEHGRMPGSMWIRKL